MKELLYIILCWIIIPKAILNKNRLMSLRLENVASAFSIYCIMGNTSYYQRKEIDQMQDISWTDRMNDLKNNGIFIAEIKAGVIYENRLIFENNFTFSNFPMLSSTEEFEKKANNKRSAFGMGYKFKNESQSLVHSLKSINMIDNLSYSFNMNESGSGLLFFGGIPNNITENKTKGECRIDSTKVGWACKVFGITIGTYNYNKPHYAYFQASESNIRAPLAFMKYFVSTILKTPMKEKDCFYAKSDYHVYCRRKVINELQTFSFAIGDSIYTFNSSLLFEPHKAAGSKIRLNPFSDDTWIIGTVFLEHFSSLFDYDNKMVSLYLNKEMENDIIITKIHNYSQIVIYILCIILVTIGLIYLLYIKYVYFK